MGIHRQGWLTQGKEQHTAGCLMSHPRQTHQIVFGFGHSPGFERIQGDMSLFFLDLLEHLFDPDRLNLVQSSALDGLGDALGRSRRYSLPTIEASLKRGRSPSGVGVGGVLGQYGFYKHVNRVLIGMPPGRPVFLFQKLDNLVDDH
jgi:hypothetical protein